MKISEHREESIKNMQSILRIFYIVFSVFIAGVWIGCSSSEESTEYDYLIETTEFDTTTVNTTSLESETKPLNESSLRPAKTTSSSQQFSVQADTVDVQSKKKQNGNSSSISVKSSAPKKFYTVEVGAFQLQSNVKRHQEQLAARFKLPVTVLFESSINLTRVCVGNFPTKKSALEFMKMMKEKYPKDYPDPWVSQLTK